MWQYSQALSRVVGLITQAQQAKGLVEFGDRTIRDEPEGGGGDDGSARCYNDAPMVATAFMRKLE